MADRNDFESMSLFEQIRAGLRDSIDEARGELTLRTTTLPAAAPALSPGRIVMMRKSAGMSQAVFAGYLNVPKRTVQSWEQGARLPRAGDARLLQIFAMSPTGYIRLVDGVQPPRKRPAKKAVRRRRETA